MTLEAVGKLKFQFKSWDFKTDKRDDSVSDAYRPEFSGCFHTIMQPHVLALFCINPQTFNWEGGVVFPPPFDSFLFVSFPRR